MRRATVLYERNVKRLAKKAASLLTKKIVAKLEVMHRDEMHNAVADIITDSDEFEENIRTELEKLIREF